MRILILTNLFPTRFDPRRASFNRQQFERLGARHRVQVLTAVDFRERMAGAKGDPGVQHVDTDDFVFFYPPGVGRWLHGVCWYLSLLLQRGRRLRRDEHDCLLASWGYPDAVAVRWLARRLRLPYVVKVHGSDLNVQAGYAWRRAQISAALRDAAGVVAVSQALADKAVALGAARERVHTIYNGVDGERFAPGERAAARHRLGLDASGPLLLFVGNLKASKGCLDLLEAFPALLARHPDARLAFVGEGPARGELLTRAGSLGIADRVRLVGAIAHGALADWFRSATLLCLPSHNEGVPNVVLEAMACATPVVASAVGGIPEVVPEFAGRLVPARDRQALAAALLDACARDWDSERIAAHARRFRWDDNIDQLERVLREATISPAPESKEAIAS